MFGNGLGYDHAGSQCFANTQLVQVGSYYAVRVCSQRILLMSALPAPIAPLPARSVGGKVWKAGKACLGARSRGLTGRWGCGACT